MSYKIKSIFIELFFHKLDSGDFVEYFLLLFFCQLLLNFLCIILELPWYLQGKLIFILYYVQLIYISIVPIIAFSSNLVFLRSTHDSFSFIPDFLKSTHDSFSFIVLAHFIFLQIIYYVVFFGIELHLIYSFESPLIFYLRSLKCFKILF